MSSASSLKQTLLNLLSDRQRLLKELLRHPRILRGSFHQVHTRCGKANCWCATARKGHAHARLTWSEAGTFTTRKVPASETEHVVELTDNYRQFRKQRRRVVALDIAIQNYLDQYETTLINEVRKPLSFLALRQRRSAKIKQPLQAAQSARKEEA
jgi:Family of unknown function (DUF6788)